MQSFSEDVSGVFSAVIGFATITNVGDAEQQLADVNHSSLTSGQKQIKALAKRIIKAIQPLFEDALRKEADLLQKQQEPDLPDLEALLDQRLGRQHSSTDAEQAIRQSTEISLVNGTKTGPMRTDNRDNERRVKEHGVVQMAPTPEDNAADAHPVDARDDADDEAAIAAQFNQDALHSGAPEPMDVDQQEATSGGAVAPLTPPRSVKDVHAPLGNGGIPWYLEDFDPVGTTVYEQKWPGREVMRDMSEPLSDMEDDELDGLVGSEGMNLADGVPPEADTAASQAVPRKARKRSRTYR